MTDRRRHDSHNDTDSRGVNDGRGKLTYEEALRRSDERMKNISRDAQRMHEALHESDHSENTPYVERYKRQTDQAGTTRHAESLQGQSRGHGQAVRRLHSSPYANDIGDENNEYHFEQACADEHSQHSGRRIVRLKGSIPEDSRDYANQKSEYYENFDIGDAGLRERVATLLSRRNAKNYRQQQRQNFSPSSYHARPATFSLNAPAPFVSDTSMRVRLIVVAVLAIVCIISAVRLGPAVASVSETRSQMDTTQAQFDELGASNDTLQSTLETMDATIAAYDKKKSES